MRVHGSDQLGDAEGISLPLQPPSMEVEDGRVGGVNNLAPDKVIVSDFTRIALLIPPQDGAHLAQLRQKVYTGEYGPPAATIAEALITRAIMCGVSV
jgi:hypothetical protein